MDTFYTVLFFLISTWIGPFWVLMLAKPFDEITEKWCQGFLIVLGPIIVYFVVLILNPNILLEIFDPDPTKILDALGTALSSPGGAVLTWAHIVAGDILVTRWLWKKAVEQDLSVNKLRAMVLFGVMLMPVAIILAMIFLNDSKNKEDEKIAN
ncbi:MAG: abscisic acid-deficient protein Aba4 family protein [Candidatus Poseidoniaceae archaeon]